MRLLDGGDTRLYLLSIAFKPHDKMPATLKFPILPSWDCRMFGRAFLFLMEGISL